MEKENNILKTENKKKLSKSDQKHEKEIDRLKVEIANERAEKEIVETKIKQLEIKFNQYNERSLMNQKSKLKEIENFENLQKSNDELRSKIEILSLQIKSDEKSDRNERELNERFEKLIKEKMTLQIEKENLDKDLNTIKENTEFFKNEIKVVSA